MDYSPLVVEVRLRDYTEGTDHGIGDFRSWNDFNLPPKAN